MNIARRCSDEVEEVMHPATPLAPVTSANSHFAQSVSEGLRNFALAERRECVRAGKLPGSSSLPHAVKLGVDMVELRNPTLTFSIAAWFDAIREPLVLTAPVGRAIEVVTGPYELWFNDEGEAFMSFADVQDATMFRLALEEER